MDVKDVRVDTYLTGFARDYGFNPDEAFVADEVAPIKQCASSAYKYKAYGTEVTDNEIDDMKAAKGGTNEIGYDITEGSGTIPTRALKVFVSDDEIKESRDPVKPAENAVIFVTKRLKLLHEIRLEVLMAATTNGATPANDWDGASGAPIADIALAKATLRAACGRKATVLVAGDHVWEELAVATGILDYVKYQSFYDILAADGEKFAKSPKWGVKPVVSSAMKDAADPGVTASLGHVIGDNAYLIRTVDGERECPWAIQPEASGFVVTKWRDEDKGGWWFKVMHKRTFKEVTATAIYEFIDIT